jgi:hypothetical protein
MQNYVVLTGIRRFDISAENAAEAITLLKQRIERRAQQRKNPDIGMSLVNALAEGRLNFLVLDASYTTILAGEYQGQHQVQPEPRLIIEFERMLDPMIGRRARAALNS